MTLDGKLYSWNTSVPVQLGTVIHFYDKPRKPLCKLDGFIMSFYAVEDISRVTCIECLQILSRMWEVMNEARPLSTPTESNEGTT